MTRLVVATEPSFVPTPPDVSRRRSRERPTPPELRAFSRRLFLAISSSAPSPPFSAPPLSQQVGDWDEETRVPRARNLYAGEAAPRGTPAALAPHASTGLVTLAANPLMRASASLLLLLGRLRASLARAGPNQLMDQVAQALQQFEVDARAANAPADQIETAKYALAACADDIVQNLPNEDGRVSTQHSMLARFFNERMGGDRFFKELERAKQNPAVNLGVLEIMHACLSLGFEGVYRASGGPGAAQGIRRDLYETICRAQSKTIEDLSRIGGARTSPCRATVSRFPFGRWPRLRRSFCSAPTSICATPSPREPRPSP